MDRAAPGTRSARLSQVRARQPAAHRLKLPQHRIVGGERAARDQRVDRRQRWRSVELRIGPCQTPPQVRVGGIGVAHRFDRDPHQAVA